MLVEVDGLQIIVKFSSRPQNGGFFYFRLREHFIVPFPNSCIRLLYSTILTAFFFSRRSPGHTCRAAASLSPSSAKGMYFTPYYSAQYSSQMQYGNFQKSEFQSNWQKTTTSLIFDCGVLSTTQRPSPESYAESELSLRIEVNAYNSGHPACTDCCR